MFTRVVVALVALVAAFAILGADVKKVPPTRTSPASGQEMFVTHCAACHGKEGKGNGPAAQALKKPPADLTTLTVRNGGKFPELRVYGAIRGESDMPVAHGSREMPVWGSVFQSMSKDASTTQMRVSNLTAYIKSIQAK